SHLVAAPDSCQGSTDGRLGRDVKNYGAVTGATHPRVADSNHVADAALQQFGRNGNLPPFWHSRPADGSCILEHEYAVLVYVQVWIVDSCKHSFVIVEDDGFPRVFQKMGGSRRSLYDGAVRSQISVECGQRPVRIQGVGKRTNHIGVVALGRSQVFSERSAVDRHFVCG